MSHRLITISNRVLWIGIALVAILLILRGLIPDFLNDYRSWNEIPAHIATYLFLTTILPGVLQRLGCTHILIRLLIAWRRTLGIAMYFFALLHLLFLLDDLPWFSEGKISSLDILTATGLFAVIALFPVLITSNTASIRFFAKNWKIIQRMTYVTIPLICVHLYETGLTLLAGLYAITSILIVVSFISHAMRKKKPLSSIIITSCVVLFFACGITFATWRHYTSDNTPIEKDVAHTTQVIEREEVETQIPHQDQDNKVILLDEEDGKFDEEEGESDEAESDTNFASGTYEANGVFVTARGKYTESVDVTLSVEDDIVTHMNVVGNINNIKSQQYQNRFEGVIENFIIGKELSEIDLDAVAGASDTTDGFMVAVQKIRDQAVR